MMCPDYTTVPETAAMSGSVRFAKTEQYHQLKALIESICQHTALAYGVEAGIDVKPRYGATINHETQAAFARKTWQALGYPMVNSEQFAAPLMASEDFSYYLNQCPGAFAIVGANATEATRPSCHSAHYDFNDDLIEPVLNWFSALVGVTAEQTHIRAK